MNSLINILQPIAEPLGWTLLNSLWQAALVIAMVVFLLRMLPLRFSRIRYAVSCAGILVIFISSAVTFNLLLDTSQKSSSAVTSFALSSSFISGDAAPQQSTTWIQDSVSIILNTVEANMSFILIVWSVGALAFSMRLVSGWWFISTLKSESTPITDCWNDQLQSLAKSLGIAKTIELAESAKVTTPMVIGFLKPLVLVPAGMLSGLSSAQVETIFLHELAHIRRHDYIVNVAQAIVETVFFFNPFVWMLSNIVRREREYCCDDEVISRHGSSLEYAKALAQLEEWKLTKSTFALTLAANKNQLLNRIKRIMEKTGKNYSAKDRLVPAALLVVGLVCASWLTVQRDEESHSRQDVLAAQDTTGKKGKASRTTIITIDENGDVHERTFEAAPGDAFSLSVPPVPSIFELPAFPAAPGFPSFPAMPPGVWVPDTIPSLWFKSGSDWEKFSREFEKEFSEQFGDFYKKNHGDFDKMMKAMEERFRADFNQHSLHEMSLADTQRAQELARLEAIQSREHFALDEMSAAQEEALASLQRTSEESFDVQLDALNENLQLAQERLELLQNSSREFEKQVRDLAVRDGYLDQNEELNSLLWEDERVEINGKKVKEKDLKKYQSLRDEHFKKTFIQDRIE